MRESQKMCLDYKLHTKIIESIVAIQRWFKSKIQREKFLSFRSAAIKIQSFWRMRLAQTKLGHLKRTRAAVVIQSWFRMWKERKMYKKFLNGLILVQAHIRGQATRTRFKRLRQQKILKERYKLRPTQSLPLDGDTIDVEISRTYSKLLQYSADSLGENVSKRSSSISDQDTSLLNKAEHQFKSLKISSNTSGLSEQITSDNKRFGSDSHSKSKIESEESVDSRSRTYNVDAAAKQYFDDSFLVKK